MPGVVPPLNFAFPLVGQASPFITAAHHAGQAWLPLGKPMLTAPDDFLVDHVPGSAFQI